MLDDQLDPAADPPVAPEVAAARARLHALNADAMQQESVEGTPPMTMAWWNVNRCFRQPPGETILRLVDALAARLSPREKAVVQALHRQSQALGEAGEVIYTPVAAEDVLIEATRLLYRQAIQPNWGFSRTPPYGPPILSRIEKDFWQDMIGLCDAGIAQVEAYTMLHRGHADSYRSTDTAAALCEYWDQQGT